MNSLMDLVEVTLHHNNNSEHMISTYAWYSICSFFCSGKSISPFCDTTSGDGPFLCNLHRTGVSYCNRLVYPAPIPAQYRVQ